MLLPVQELTSLQVWDMFEGGHLFTGYDQEHQTYRSRAHLAEITSLLGQPPQALLQLGMSTHKFYTGTGKSMPVDYKSCAVLTDKSMPLQTNSS